MNIDLFSFLAGAFLATVIATLPIAYYYGRINRRAEAFITRFDIISTGLSSLKALAFRASGELRNLRQESSDAQKMEKCMESVAIILETLSEGMMPPTQEIARSALYKKGGDPAEERAYQDGKKFRDDMRQLRQLLEKHGLEGLSKGTGSHGEGNRTIKIIDS